MILFSHSGVDKECLVNFFFFIVKKSYCIINFLSKCSLLEVNYHFTMQKLEFWIENYSAKLILKTKPNRANVFLVFASLVSFCLLCLSFQTTLT